MKKNNFKSLMQAAVLICTPLVIASCDDVFGDVDNPISSYMSVKKDGVTLWLKATCPDSAFYTRTANAATGAEIVYSSTNEEVATVDAKTGKITAVGEGQCKIIVAATGKDSNGRMTYQEAQDSFPVTVKDYRCRVNLIDGVEIPAFNKADKDLAEIDLTKIVEAWPKNVALTFVSDNKGVADMVSGKLKLIGGTGTAKVTAEIKAADVPAGFEQASFPTNQITKEFEITVEDGVAYIAGYDATGKAIRKTIFKDFNGEKYTDLSEVLKGSSDVTLDAGWYYVNDDLTGFTNNIRVKGDVNIILNDDHPLTLTKDLMDESAKQNYKLNFYSQRKNGATPEIGTAAFANIKEFKEVNIFGAQVTAPVNAVVDVTINNGQIGDLIGTGAGSVDITNATPSMGVGQVSKFKTVAINKGTAASSVSGIDHVTTVTISEGATVGAMNDITNLTVNKAASIGSLYDINTVVITETPIRNMNDITELTLNKVKTNYARTLSGIESVTINKTDGTAKFTSIGANALNISDGTIEVGTTGTTTSATDGQIAGFDKNGAADTKVTMTGGKLTVNGPEGAKFAILGDVEVTGGTFWACSPDHHAVSGALVGSFEGSTDNKTWTAITGAERPKYIQNKKSE
jgi:hypothetical protein